MSKKWMRRLALMSSFMWLLMLKQEFEYQRLGAEQQSYFGNSGMYYKTKKECEKAGRNLSRPHNTPRYYGYHCVKSNP
jgi:hypothetical protein